MSTADVEYSLDDRERRWVRLLVQIKPDEYSTLQGLLFVRLLILEKILSRREELGEISCFVITNGNFLFSGLSEKGKSRRIWN